MSIHKRYSSVDERRVFPMVANYSDMKKEIFLPNSPEVSPDPLDNSDPRDNSEDQVERFRLWQKRKAKVEKFKKMIEKKKKEKLINHKNIQKTSISETVNYETNNLETSEQLPTLVNKIEMPRFTVIMLIFILAKKQRLKLPNPDFNQYIIFDKKRSKPKALSHEVIQRNSRLSTELKQNDEIINSLDQRRQKIIVDNIYGQILEKYDGISGRKNRNFVSPRFQENIRKNLHRFQPSNSSINPEAQFLLNYKQLNHKNSTESSILHSNDSVFHSPSPNIRSKYLDHHHRKRLGQEFERSQKLLDFIANTYTQEIMDSRIQMKQIDKYKVSMNEHLLDTQWILREDEYDYDRQVSYSFKQNEQKETLQEVKLHLLSQMPVNQYKGIMVKGLSKHTKRFVQDRMQKYFPVEDIQKYLYKIQE